MSDTFNTTVHGFELGVKAIGDRIVVECIREIPEKFVTSNIILPQTTSHKLQPSKGRVRAVGPKVSGIKPGDVVHWGVGCGVGFDDGRLRVVRMGDVFAIESD